MTTAEEATPQVLEPWQRLKATVEAAAGSLMKHFGRWVEYDDVVQTIWVAYFEHPLAFDRLEGTRLAYVRLKKAGSRFCQQEMAYRIGLDFGAQYHYSRGEVRGLLEFAFSEGGLDGGEGQATICGWVDLSRALGEIGPEERHTLSYAYGPHEREPLTTSQRTATARALGKLQRAMNVPLRLTQTA